MNLLVMRRLLVEIELLQDHAQLIVLPPPCPLRASSMDFGHADELIREGHASAADHLDAIAAGCDVPAVPASPI